jgi:uncharacterized protein YndB with AHSA1/START domain
MMIFNCQFVPLLVNWPSTMPNPQKIAVQAIRRYDAPADKVYEAFLDPAKAGKFMFASEKGQIIRAEVDPRVGGKFVFVDRRSNGDAEHYGTFTELERPKKVAFSFAVTQDAAISDPVTITIMPRGKGCEVSLTHYVDAKYAPHKDKISEGWTGILAGLAQTLF